MTTHAEQPMNERDFCAYCQDHLEEAALGTLEPQDDERIQQHLDECPACARDLEELRAAVGVLPYACEEAIPGADVRTSLMNRLTAETATVSEPLVSPTKPTSAWRIVASGVLAAALLVALWGAWSIFESQRGDGDSDMRNLQVLAMERSCPECEGDPGGQIGADLETQDGVVIAWNLDPTQPHQVWCLKHNGERVLIGDLVLSESGSAMQPLSFPEAVGSYDQIIVQRHDGTQELSVKPIKRSGETGDDPTAVPTDTD